MIRAKHQMTHPQALEVLGLQSGATERQLKSAYRSKAKEHHPDKGGDKENFIIVKTAYDMLVEVGTTPNLRKQATRDFSFINVDPFTGVSVTVTWHNPRWANL